MFRLSTFLNLSFSYRNNLSVDQQEYGYNFFKELADLDVEKTYNNNIFNGIRDLSTTVKDYLINDPKGKKRCIDFISWLESNLQKITINDYLDKIKTSISGDETISEATKKGLIKPLEDGKNGVFLCKALRYALTKDNVDVKTTIDVCDLNIVLEANKCCALCGKKIQVKKDKKDAYKYAIINIFPRGLDKTKKALFTSISPEPKDYNHDSNRICCCTSCADDYECSPTTSVFEKLLDKKLSFQKTDEANSNLEKAKLDEDIFTVLQKLKGIKSFNEIATFRNTPLELKEKIADNELLRISIKTDVENYYNYIRKQLSELDDNDSEFIIIASQFQICYKKLSKIIDDQEEIYNKIIDWVLNELKLTNNYRTAAHIIVSFFVQNCEVFDEIPK